MPGINYVIYDFSSAKTTQEVYYIRASLYRSLTLKENIVAVITQDIDVIIIDAISYYSSNRWQIEKSN